jgi:hypothetical protein
MPTTTGKIYLGSNLVAGGEGVAPPVAAEWLRPADWPALPAVAATDQVFYGLHAVFDHGSNFATISATGAFTVDWGDGSAPVNVASDTTAEYNYSYAATGLGPVTERGYKTAIVTVTPQAGQTLSAINLSLKHTQTGLVNGHSSQWLDIRLAMNNLGTVTTYLNDNWRHRLLEQFEWVGNNGQTNFSNFLRNCSSLQNLPAINTQNGTIFNSFLQGCSSLQNLPAINTQNGTNFSSFLQSCSSLQNLPAINTQNGTNFSSFLNGCSSLQNLPAINTQNGTIFNSFLNGCSSLQNLPAINTQNGTSFSNFLQSCSSLQNLPAINTQNGTIFNSFLQGCSSLQNLPAINTQNGTNFSNFLQSCSSLQNIPSINTQNGTSFSSFLSGCSSLSRIQATFPANQSFSLANLALGPDALNEIYTNLPTAVGTPTITVTGNWGTAAHDPTIATAKGWTVTA